MSDELPPGSISLEDDTEIVSAPVAAEPANEPATEEPEPEGTVEIPTGKVVPLQALQAERGKAKEAKAEAEAIRAELDAARQKMQEYATLDQKLREAMPYIEETRRRRRRGRWPHRKLSTTPRTWTCTSRMAPRM